MIVTFGVLAIRGLCVSGHWRVMPSTEQCGTNESKPVKGIDSQSQRTRPKFYGSIVVVRPKLNYSRGQEGDSRPGDVGAASVSPFVIPSPYTSKLYLAH